MSEKVDFVITWVDGNDTEWQKSKAYYTGNSIGDSRDIRFRDWGNLQYLFRGIEQFTPWVNKVHFVTWGHLPEWLNTEHPKLNIVNHRDFIPNEYLPTFSSHSIELNLHRIKDLSNKFVYFNDDTFILKFMPVEDFFVNNLPRDIAVIMHLINDFRNSTGAIVSNNMEIINTTYNKRRNIKNNIFKWFNLTYKKHVINTILMMPYKKFTGFFNPHLPNSFLKESYQELWEDEYDILHKTCKNKLRDGRDVNQWLIRYKQIVEGKFIPRSPDIGRTYSLTNNNENVLSTILNQKHKLICINDNDKEKIHDFEKVKSDLVKSFECIMPNKSEFEK